MEIRVPKFGMSAVEVEVLEIFVRVGQTIALGDPVLELETDKVTAVVEAEHAGVVTSIAVEVGDTRVVGDVLCTVE